MFSRVSRPTAAILLLSCAFTCWATGGWAAATGRAPEDLFANASFEDGRDLWQLDRAGKTTATFSVDDKEAAAGRRSAVLSVGAVEEWGIQFGQMMEAPAVGKTCTFAVLAKSTKGPATIRLEIERRGSPYDRAAASQPQTVAKDAWTELYVTFKVEKPYAEGWFAYVSCRQPDVEFRLDAFRLYAGDYVPYEKAAQTLAASAAVSLFDTGAASSGSLSGEAIAERTGWTQVPEDNTDHKFAGDAVVANDRLAIVLRRGGPGAEVYCLGGDRPTLRAVLTPAAEKPAGKLTSIAVAGNGPDEVAVDGAFAESGGKSIGLRLELAMGQAFIRTEPRGGATALRVEAPCRFLVLPDFFADDIVIDARELSVAQAELPSENFLLHLLPARDAIVMTVATKRVQDARIELASQGPGNGGPAAGDASRPDTSRPDTSRPDARQIECSQMFYGTGGSISVAVLQGKNIWHTCDVGKDQAGKVMNLDWKSPFAAQWRVDWRLANSLTDSWEMLAQLKNGQFMKHAWFGNPGMLPPDRKHWTTVLGSFQYPCWIDCDARGWLQPLARPGRFQGPALIYPINRIRETPLDEFTVVDVVRATLGVGPCEYILDVEGQGTAMRGRATCATRDTLEAIYAARQQKGKRAEIEKALSDVVIFVKHIRGRIEQYVAFGRETSAYLDEQKKDHPESAGFLAEMDAAVRAIDAAYSKREASIKTPQYVVDLTEKFRKTLLDYEGDDALKQCIAITHAIVDVGGNQDELVGECRAAVKVLRQRAGLAMATNPGAAEIAREIRDRTQKILRDATSYEAPRH